MNTHNIGSPGSVARYLSERSEPFAAPFVVFEYPSGGGEPIVRAVQSTREGAASYMAPGRMLVDVRTYGIAVEGGAS